MTHKTRGIVLRTIKYGETSLVVTVFTELFGIQTYMVNGVRSTKKSAAKANLFQPTAILDLIVYHNESSSMQRIKEFSWGFLYREVLHDVVRNSIAAYMMELLQKCLKQPEPNTDLFNFCEEVLMQLDAAPKNVAANFPLFFAIQLAHFFGFRMAGNYSAENCILDLEEGNFTGQQPTHPHFIEGEYAQLTAQLLQVMQPHELEQIKLNRISRRELLIRYHDYYALHISDFGQMKTLMVLHEVL
jgi:DNA repair protein RecO (recombination protein O)